MDARVKPEDDDGVAGGFTPIAATTTFVMLGLDPSIHADTAAEVRDGASRAEAQSQCAIRPLSFS